MENTQVELEFYKIMKEEYRHYLEVFENLWKLKLLTIGAIISFALLNEKVMKLFDNNDLVALGVLVIPILAFLIDIIILGIGFHLKNISHYLHENLKALPIAKNWEQVNWEWKGNSFSKYRSIITLWGTVGISFTIHLICLITVALFLKTEWLGLCVVLGLFLFFASIILSTLVSKKLYTNQFKRPVDISE